jgi:hypothetical protein
MMDKVHIQHDNASTENNNKFVAALYTWLVETGLLKKLRFHSIMSGEIISDSTLLCIFSFIKH